MNYKTIIWSIVVLLIGMIIGFWLHKAFFAGEDQGLLLWSYYFFQILGGIGTCMAVVVALFKDSIKTFIWHPKFNFELLEEGIIEVINHNDNNPTADSYKGILRVMNDGNDSAKRCEITIEKIEYAQRGTNVFDTIHDFKGKRRVDWGSDSIIIPKGKFRDIDLYKITKATRLPQEGNGGNQPAEPESYLIDLYGPEIEDKYRKAGKLRICYCLSYDDGLFRNFTLSIDGDGLWRGRKEELRRYFNLNLEAV